MRPRLRLGTRLSAAIVLVAVSTGGVLAGATYVLVRRYREHTFDRNVEQNVELGVFGPAWPLGRSQFEQFVADLGHTTQVPVVGAYKGRPVGTSPERFADPALLAVLPAPDQRAPATTVTEVDIGGDPYRVAVARTSDDEVLYFFFSRRYLLRSLTDFRTALAIGWLVAVGAAALLGLVASRQTLRPVRDVAQAAKALADGALDTRLEIKGRDEIASLASSFNRMADAVEAQINDLARTAERERRFTSDVAHELRTPLSSIIATAALVEDRFQAIDGDGDEAVQVLVADARRLRDVTLELLELARLDAGSDVLDLEPLAVRPSIAAATQAWGRDHRIAVDVDDDLAVVAHPGTLRRILENLVANAVTHGRGEVEIGARREGERVVIDVSDRGPGLPDTDPGQVFARFYKGDHSRASGGSGLGLAIAAEHTRVLGGTLTAANRDRGGARFVLTLPAASAMAIADGDAPAVPQ